LKIKVAKWGHQKYILEKKKIIIILPQSENDLSYIVELKGDYYWTDFTFLFR
jgi:hypothetical protein